MKKNLCPEFPYFGAKYPDARCIDGYLWDMDSTDESGLFTIGGEIPCPFCNTEMFIVNDTQGVFDKYVIEIAGENEPTERQLALARLYTVRFYKKEIEKLREKHK